MASSPFLVTIDGGHGAPATPIVPRRYASMPAMARVGGRGTDRRSRSATHAQPPPDADRLRMFATTVPGLAPVAAAELRAAPGVAVRDTGFDGRADVVVFDVAPHVDPATVRPRTVEDVFVEVGRTLRSEGDRARWIAGRLWRAGRAERALRAALAGRRHAARRSFRTIVRVRQETSFRRTELRRALTDAVAADRPDWRVDDPADLEIWALEYRRGRFLAGLRVSDAGLRQHGGRAVERPGALRPAVAAAMVRLAGPAPADTAVLLDPCCGSGTILAEALAAGWSAIGRDVDPAAVRAARANVPRALVEPGDARHLDLPDGAAHAVVSNLPFGQRYPVEGTMAGWLTAVLGELCRVARPDATVVVLTPDVPRTALPAGLRPVERHSLRLLGTRATVWSFRRVEPPRAARRPR